MASWPMHRRAQWPGYRPARSGLSTVIVNKLSHDVEEFWDAKKSLYLGALAALGPQSCDVLTIRYALNRRTPVGVAGGYLPGRGDLDEPVAFPMRPRKLRETCAPLSSRFRPVFSYPASDSRNSLRAVRATPDERPSKGRKCKVWIVCEVLSMLMEFGGTQG